MNHSTVSNLDAASAPKAEIAPALLFPALPGKQAGAHREPKSIKRLVRHRLTRLYFCDGSWTENPLEATTFSDSLQAAQACARHGLIDVELAISVGSGSFDFFSTQLR